MKEIYIKFYIIINGMIRFFMMKWVIYMLG